MLRRGNDMKDILIKSMENKEAALPLVWKVFSECEAPVYPKEGVEEFYRSIHDPEYLQQLCMYGAFIDEKLVGVIAARNEKSHIALFFVEGEFRGQGVGRRLFEKAKGECVSNKMTVNSSPYAVPIYEKFGFVPTDREQVVKGIRFTPMELKLV